MPYKIKHGCRYPGCNKLTNEEYCTEHKKIMQKNYDNYTRSPDHNKKYGYEWKRIRGHYAKEHPLCELCFKEGKYTNSIIIQVDLNGLLQKSLNEFTRDAEQEVKCCQHLQKYSDLFNENDLFVNFNYTHTLEQTYHINESKVLHIHGEIGKNDLLLGYPIGEYKPEKYYYDVRCKGRGPYIPVDIEEHIKRMLEDESMDYYTYTAFSSLIEKTKSFSKTPQIEKLIPFLQDTYIDAIVVIGHSCSIDYTYFEYLNKKYPSALWSFNPHDNKTKGNIQKLINRTKIKKYNINIDSLI